MDHYCSETRLSLIGISQPYIMAVGVTNIDMETLYLCVIPLAGGVL